MLSVNLMKRLITFAAVVLALVVSIQEGRSGGFSQVGRLPAGFSPAPDTFTTLANGQMLFTSGDNAELYDPVAGVWTVTGSLISMSAYTATLLPNGEVLALSGPVNGSLNTAELYNPTTGAWNPTGPLTAAHGIDYAVTVLANGQVLVTGGVVPGGVVANAEVFSPGPNSWQAVSPMPVGRRAHTATLLANGRVLVAGGWNPGSLYLNVADLYDPTRLQWTPTGTMVAGDMNTARGGASATRLPNGNVLVAGGLAGPDSSLIYASAEVYDAGQGTWTATGPMTGRHFDHAALLLTNGQVLVAGGYATYDPVNYIEETTVAAETYNPSNNAWSATGGHLHRPRVWPTGLQPLAGLPDGRALVAGGAATSSGADLEFYDPAATLYFDYATNGNALTITNYTGNSGNVLVPAGVGGMPVTDIGANAFAGNSALTSIVISNGVAAIGNAAFAGCSGLTNAAIPGSVASLGNQAFYNCSSLTNLTLTNGLTSIGNDAFGYSLVSVTLPGTVTNIGTIAFSTLQSINVDPANPWYSSQGGVLFNQNQTVLVECPQVRGSYTIPSGVLDIAADAFVQCTGLTRLFVPASVTRMEDYSIVSGSALTGVYFHGNAPSLGTAGPFSNTHPTIYYVPGTSGWGPSFDNLITTTWSPPPPVPTIVSPPASLTNFVNATVSFAVQAIGTGPFSYQWQFNGVNLTNAVASGLTLTNAQLISAGNYRVIIANGGGSVTSSVATLTLLIPDTTPPTLTLVNPSPGLQVSNAAFTVTGAAHDNVAVATVLYSLNQTAWINAATTNGWTNWTAPVTLLPGTNTLAVYAADPSGNPSTTNRVSLIYVLSATLTVSTNGLGSLSQAYNGAALQIGKNYVLTATPRTGFIFTNWTGGTNLPLAPLTNGPTLEFKMVANLRLQANFVDVQPPVAAITNLTAGQRVTGAAFTLRGNASDNWEVTNVWGQLNQGGWTSATGTNNWSLGVTLAPGTNSAQVFAVDNSGNRSLTNTVIFDCVVTNQLGLQTLGWGTFSVNDSNAWLEVGRNYALTAVPATGFVFTNWTISTNGTGGATTNHATVQFMMASNLTLTASFVDVQPPVAAITNLTAGQRVAGTAFILRGNASDNWRVTNVWVQLNQGGWTSATGTNNWSAGVILAPGTNSAQVYAVDNSGNRSLTNTVIFDCVVTNQLGLQTLGWGTFSVNDSNAWLEVGRNYSLTAVPATGFAFTNWTISTNGTGGATTNHATVQFMMASNLTLTARFVEVTKPVVTITNLIAGQKLNRAGFAVKGTTSDNWRVTNVWCCCVSDPNGWLPASSTNLYQNWSATNLSLSFGTNLIKVYAVDQGGNNSGTNSVTVVVTNAVITAAATGLTPPVLWLTNAQITAAGLTFSLQVSGAAGGAIQVSTNLTDWASVTNFAGTNTTINFCDPAVTNGRRWFYRAVAP